MNREREPVRMRERSRLLEEELREPVDISNVPVRMTVVQTLLDRGFSQSQANVAADLEAGKRHQARVQAVRAWLGGKQARVILALVELLGDGADPRHVNDRRSPWFERLPGRSSGGGPLWDRAIRQAVSDELVEGGYTLDSDSSHLERVILTYRNGLLALMDEQGDLTEYQIPAAILPKSWSEQVLQRFAVAYGLNTGVLTRGSAPAWIATDVSL